MFDLINPPKRGRRCKKNAAVTKKSSGYKKMLWLVNKGGNGAKKSGL